MAALTQNNNHCEQDLLYSASLTVVFFIFLHTFNHAMKHWSILKNDAEPQVMFCATVVIENYVVNGPTEPNRSKSVKQDQLLRSINSCWHWLIHLYFGSFGHNLVTESHWCNSFVADESLFPHCFSNFTYFGAFLYTRTSLTYPIMANNIDNTQDALVKDTATLTMRFHEHVHSEDCAVRLPQQNKILRTTMQCPGRIGRSCGKPIRLYRKRKNKKYDVWRCNTRACR